MPGQLFFKLLLCTRVAFVCCVYNLQGESFKINDGLTSSVCRQSSSSSLSRLSLPLTLPMTSHFAKIACSRMHRYIAQHLFSSHKITERLLKITMEPVLCHNVIIITWKSFWPNINTSSYINNYKCFFWCSVSLFSSLKIFGSLWRTVGTVGLSPRHHVCNNDFQYASWYSYL